VIWRGFDLALLSVFFSNAIQSNAVSGLVLLASVWLLGHLLGGTRQHPGPAALLGSGHRRSCSSRACAAVLWGRCLRSLSSRPCLRERAFIFPRPGPLAWHSEKSLRRVRVQMREADDSNTGN